MAIDVQKASFTENGIIQVQVADITHETQLDAKVH